MSGWTNAQGVLVHEECGFHPVRGIKKQLTKIVISKDMKGNIHKLKSLRSSWVSPTVTLRWGV
jgi:hypothetical protein